MTTKTHHVTTDLIFGVSLNLEVKVTPEGKAEQLLIITDNYDVDKDISEMLDVDAIHAEIIQLVDEQAEI